MKPPRLLVALAAAAALSIAGLANAPGADARKPLYGVASSSYPTEAEMQRLAAGGAHSLRFLVQWGAVEPTPGAREWASLDALATGAAKSGIELIPMLFGTPSWLAANPVRPPIQNDAARAAWSAFIADLLARYGENGSFWAAHPELPPAPIDFLQIWNEVNLRYYWGSRPSPRQYASLLRISRAAMRSVEPGAKLILAGVIPFKSVGVGSVSGRRFLQRLCRIRGVGRLFDVVAVHPYAKRPKILLKWMTVTRATLNALPGCRAPIWVTEFGWTTGGADWRRSPIRATLSQQARWVTRSYRLLRRHRKRLKLQRTHYFSFEDSAIDSWVGHMGLFDSQGQPKPAWYEFAKAAGGQP